MWLYSYCKEKKVTALVICHLNGSRDYGGGKGLQHAVDVLVFMSDLSVKDEDGKVIEATKGVVEISIDGKNRNGGVHETALLQMQEDGSGLKPLSMLAQRRFSKLTLVGE